MRLAQYMLQAVFYQRDQGHAFIVGVSCNENVLLHINENYIISKLTQNP